MHQMYQFFVSTCMSLSSACISHCDKNDVLRPTKFLIIEDDHGDKFTFCVKGKKTQIIIKNNVKSLRLIISEKVECIFRSASNF